MGFTIVRNLIRYTRPAAEQHPGYADYLLSKIHKNIGTGTDDAAKLAFAIAKIDGEGGGRLIIDLPIKIGADVDCPRSVIPVGIGPSRSIIHSDGTQRRFNVTGVPADATDFEGDYYAVSNLTFDNVSLELGPGLSDVPRGARALHCQFYRSDRGLCIHGENDTAFSGVGAAFCKFRICTVGILCDQVGPAYKFIGNIIDECKEAAYKFDGGVPDGVSVDIIGGYSDHCARFLKVVGSPTTDGTINVIGGGLELVGTADAGTVFPDGTSFPSGHYTDGYGVEMEWGQVWFKGVNFFGNNANTTANHWLKGGTLYIRDGRQDWNYIARMDGGALVFYQDSVFSSAKIWGEGMGAYVHPSSTSGKIFAPRAGYVGRQNLTLTQLTNASPTQTFQVTGPFDGNDRVWECDLVTSSLGSQNVIRIDLADGSFVARLDMQLPYVVGGGRLRIVHRRGTEFSARILYAPNANGTLTPAAGNPPTKAEFDVAINWINTREGQFIRGSTPDITLLANSKFLAFSTISFTGTASTMTISNIEERIMGPAQVGI